MFTVRVFGLFVNLRRLSSLFLPVVLCMVLGLSREKTTTLHLFPKFLFNICQYLVIIQRLMVKKLLPFDLRVEMITNRVIHSFS